MPIQKIKSGRIITTLVNDYVGDKGIIFYDEDTPALRLSDGVTPGGILITGGGSTGTVTLVTATNTRLGGVKIGTNIIVEADGTISTAPIPTNLSDLNNDLGFLSSSSLTWNNITDKPSFSTVSTSGSYTDLINTPTIPTSLLDLSISDGQSGEVLTTDGSGNFSFTQVLTTGSELNSFSDVDIVNIQNGQTLIYNSSTLKFENTSINLIGGSANQILVKQSGSDYDYQWEDLNITLPINTVYTKLIDDISTTSTLYLGEAVPESIESDPVWRIQKIVFDTNGNVDSVRFAGTGTFTQVWDNRIGLTYL